jgi:hypothetical protein
MGSLPRVVVVWGLLAVAVAGCFSIGSRSMEEVSLIGLNPVPQPVQSPVRAFLGDGSVVVFPSGSRISSAAIFGDGQRYDLHRTFVGPAERVDLDSVVGIEAFTRETDVGLSLLASIGTTAVVIAGTVALICAMDPKCFGSCPTVYVMEDDGEVLEAELFSYSISPLLEGRDVDRLAVVPDSLGTVALEIRNEALETHYINHLELLEVRHRADQRVVPGPDQVPVVLGPLSEIPRVRDRSGRDVTAELRARDDRVFASTPERVAAVTADDSRDWIEFTLPAVAGDTAALYLRVRNSLLSTVLFYEFMLGSQGARALDWMGRDIEQIGNALEVGTWYHRTMGLRLEVDLGEGFQEVVRLADTGPIAWNEVALPLPVRAGRPTPVRLSFLADAWRIDRLAWTPDVAPAPVRVHPVAEVEPLRGGEPDDLLERLLAPDDRYVVTSAGTAFTVRFHPGPGNPGDEAGTRTFLLASQGYYSEWVRPDWIRSARSPEPFRPSEGLMPELMERWSELRAPMEESFHATRIPVR